MENKTSKNLPSPPEKRFTPTPIETKCDIVDKEEDKMPEVDEKQYDIPTEKEAEIPSEQFVKISHSSSSKSNLEQYDQKTDRGSKS